MAFLDETGLAELWSLIKAEDVKTAQIATGSYTGTGAYGSSNPCSLTFNFDPMFVVIQNGGTLRFWAGGTVLTSGGTSPVSATAVKAGNKLLWYNNSSAANQLNVSGTTYKWVAVGSGLAEEVDLIQFNFYTTIQFAGNGMTWAEWIDSGYDIGHGLYVSGSYVVSQEGGTLIRSSNKAKVKATDTIIANETYTVDI